MYSKYKEWKWNWDINLFKIKNNQLKGSIDYNIIYRNNYFSTKKILT